MVVAVGADLFCRHELPAVGPNLILMYIREDVSLISSSINVKMVELSNKSVVCPRLGRILRVEIHPLVLKRLVLGQVIEVVSSLACVATKEEDTILKF